IKNFYSASFDMQFTQEQHNGSPIHYACTRGDQVFELYPFSEINYANSLFSSVSLRSFKSIMPIIHLELPPNVDCNLTVNNIVKHGGNIISYGGSKELIEAQCPLGYPIHLFRSKQKQPEAFAYPFKQS